MATLPLTEWVGVQPSRGVVGWGHSLSRRDGRVVPRGGRWLEKTNKQKLFPDQSGSGVLLTTGGGRVYFIIITSGPPSPVTVTPHHHMFKEEAFCTDSLHVPTTGDVELQAARMRVSHPTLCVSALGRLSPPAAFIHFISSNETRPGLPQVTGV